MALVMMQGHVFDALVSPLSRADPLYLLQATLHGSTAPGFLFASGFVAGLPRAPLSLTASLRRAKRLLFVLGVGYAIHLPYFSAVEDRALRHPRREGGAVRLRRPAGHRGHAARGAGLQWIFGRLLGRRWRPPSPRSSWWPAPASGPRAWRGGFPLPLGAYLDMSVAPSQFPIFPFAAFVLAGTVAGAALGRQDPETRRRRGLVWGFGLMAAGVLLSIPLRGVVDFWGVSPAYALIRIGALLLILLGVEALSRRHRRWCGPWRCSAMRPCSSTCCTC